MKIEAPFKDGRQHALDSIYAREGLRRRVAAHNPYPYGWKWTVYFWLKYRLGLSRLAWKWALLTMPRQRALFNPDASEVTLKGIAKFVGGVILLALGMYFLAFIRGIL